MPRVRYALIGLFVLLQAVPCHAQLTSNVLRRVFLIKVDNNEGTAFTIEVDGRQYVVTAKHMVTSTANGAKTTVRMMRKDGWKALKVTVLKCDDPVDIAVLVPPRTVDGNV